MYGNSLYYHTCCNSFSRRTFCATAGHPAACTTNIRKLPGYREVDSATALFVLILDKVNAANREGKMMLFPTINRRHYQSPTEDDEAAHLHEENAVLAKRCKDLEKELGGLKTRLQDYQINHKCLLESSKTWCMKYQLLLDQQEGREELLATPKKKTKVTRDELFLEDC